MRSFKTRATLVILVAVALLLYACYGPIPWYLSWYDSRDYAIARLDFGKGVNRICRVGSSSMIACGLSDGRIVIADVDNESSSKELFEHSCGVKLLSASIDGKYLCSVDANDTLILWNSSDWTRRRIDGDKMGNVLGCAFSGRGAKIAIWTGSQICIYSCLTLKLEWAAIHHQMISGLAFVADEQLIFVDARGVIYTKTVDSIAAIESTRVIGGMPNMLVSSGMSEFSYIGCGNGNLFRYNASLKVVDQLPSSSTEPARCIAISLDGFLLAVAYGAPSNPPPIGWGKCSVVVQFAETGEIVRRYGWFPSPLSSVVFLKGGRFATSEFGRGVTVWRIP